MSGTIRKRLVTRFWQVLLAPPPLGLLGITLGNCKPFTTNQHLCPAYFFFLEKVPYPALEIPPKRATVPPHLSGNGTQMAVPPEGRGLQGYVNLIPRTVHSPCPCTHSAQGVTECVTQRVRPHHKDTKKGPLLQVCVLAIYIKAKEKLRCAAGRNECSFAPCGPGPLFPVAESRVPQICAWDTDTLMLSLQKHAKHAHHHKG